MLLGANWTRLKRREAPSRPSGPAKRPPNPSAQPSAREPPRAAAAPSALEAPSRTAHALPRSSFGAAVDEGNTSLTTHVAIDCEMVGVGPDGKGDALARCSVVNWHGGVLFDKFVRPLERVTDYRTEFSGVRREDLESSQAVDFKECQEAVAKLLDGRYLIGHSVRNDLRVLMLSHPRSMIRDTSRWKGLCPLRPRALRKLTEEHLGVAIQSREHNPVEDARAAMLLYRKFQVAWEKGLVADLVARRRASRADAQALRDKRGEQLEQAGQQRVPGPRAPMPRPIKKRVFKRRRAEHLAAAPGKRQRRK